MPELDTGRAVAEELGLPLGAVKAVMALLDEGATVPFIARYRKEATTGLDEVAIRNILDRRTYLRELDARRESVIDEIRKQNALSPKLHQALLGATTKTALEDLYAPFKSKRRTRAVMAKERGLEALSLRIWNQPMDGSPQNEGRSLVNRAKGVNDADDALSGARDICAERIADHAGARQLVRETYTRHAKLSTVKTKEHRTARTKFDDYERYHELTRNIAPHRYLAIRRGESEGVLTVTVKLDDDPRLLSQLQHIAGVNARSPWSTQLQLAVEDGYARLLTNRASSELRADLKDKADRNAVDVFARNLRALLLAPPYGAKAVLGVDPGQRTGCKCAVVSASGKLVSHDTVYLVQGEQKLVAARDTIVRLCRAGEVTAIAVGNGTHGRETETFMRDVVRDAKLDVVVVSVSEAGASIYSASDVARAELPDVDLTVRGAVSIARRLQDPLAELVKIEPKSIGVGQYQHDVPPGLLSSKLDEVIEDCVNGVGVDLNTASAPLLSRVAGLGPKLAQRIVDERHRRGRFRSRAELMKVSGLGSSTFQQAAGFLRIRNGDQPLDASAVHPERYPLVERIAKDLGVKVPELIGNAEKVGSIDERRYLSDDVGTFTLKDILGELRKPGRDPRAGFEPPQFRDDVRSIGDLREGMELEGVVTNVTTFGAFVDVGVKQDGLVHVSQLSDRFVKDPSQIVQVGARLKVRVLSIDIERKRISLSANKRSREGGN